MPKNQYHPTPEERDERVKVDLRPDEFIAGVMETGPQPEDDDSDRIQLAPEQLAQIRPVIATVEEFRAGKGWPLKEAELSELVPMLASRGLDEPSIAYLCTTSPANVRRILSRQ